MRSSVFSVSRVARNPNRTPCVSVLPEVQYAPRSSSTDQGLFSFSTSSASTSTAASRSSSAKTGAARAKVSTAMMHTNLFMEWLLLKMPEGAFSPFAV